ncbi:MAG TPA: ATP-binding protein [Oligoflexus sp.]|uniref:ATP-binding protein n=1 Tax=Oligoflexus sp. TaxID=1971216 RepID=UPI002D4C8508|nr:ATP-binding protein [Oligoflexus sp.]HYX32544.1 ATP-binding protein [Oligoflexus sp.]
MVCVAPGSTPGAASFHEIKNWEYHWGDFPLSAPGHYEIGRNSTLWTPFENDLLRPPERGDNTVGWLRARLPDTWDYSNPAIFFPGFDLAVHIFIEDQLLFQFGGLEFQGFRHALLHLPQASAGTYLYIRIFSDHTNLGLFHGVRLGNYEDLIFDIINKNAEIFGAGLFFVLAALVMGLIASLNWQRKEILALALVSACAGCVILFVPTNTLSQFFFTNYLMNHLLFQFSMYAVAAPFALFVEKMFPARPTRILPLLRFVMLGYAGGALTLSVAGWIRPMSALLPGEILLLVACAVIITRVFLALWRREPHSVIFGLGTLFLFLGTVRDICVEMDLLSTHAVPVSLHYWVLAFFGCMITALIRSITTAYAMVDQNARTIQDNNRQLARLNQEKDGYLEEVKQLNLHLEKKVEEQTLEIKMILQTIEQGILIVDPEGRISQDHSRYSLRLLGEHQLAMQTLDQAVLTKTDLGADERQQITHTLQALIHEDILVWELNAPAFPRFFYLKDKAGERAIEAEWTPFLDENARISRVLLTLRDVTEILQYRRDAQAREEEWQDLMQLVRVPSRKFRIFMEHSLHLLEFWETSLKQETSAEAFKVCLRHLHTLKGNARTLGLRRLSGALHKSEEQLLQAQPTSKPDDLQQNLMEQLRKLKSLLDEYQRLNDQVLDRGPIETLPKNEENAMTLQALITIFQPAMEELAQTLGKRPPYLAVSGSPLIIPPQLYFVLKNICMHLFHNALDHGLEVPAMRLASGKPPAGSIAIHAALHDEKMVLHVSDDGRGLNLQEFRGRMKVPSPKDEDAAALIFQDQVTTRKEVTEISGRGLGLAAVRHLLESHGGSIDIVLLNPAGSEDFRPFKFVVKLPLRTPKASVSA